MQHSEEPGPKRHKPHHDEILRVHSILYNSCIASILEGSYMPSFLCPHRSLYMSTRCHHLPRLPLIETNRVSRPRPRFRKPQHQLHPHPIMLEGPSKVRRHVL